MEPVSNQYMSQTNIMVKHSSTKMSGGYGSSMANVMEKDTEDSNTRLTSEI